MYTLPRSNIYKYFIALMICYISRANRTERSNIGQVGLGLFISSCEPWTRTHLPLCTD